MSKVEKLQTSGKNRSFFTKKKIISLFVFTLLIGTVLEIWVSNRLATFGEQYTKIEQSISDLTLENQLLEDQIAKRESLSRTEKYAGLSGFEEVNNIEYITSASGSAVMR